DLLQGVLGLFAYAEAHAQDLLLPRRERGQHLVYLFVQVGLDQRVVRRGHGLVLDEVAPLSVVIGARGRCEGERLPRNLQELARLFRRQRQLLRDLVGGRFTSELVDERSPRARELVEGLLHVDRDPDRARLIDDGTRDALPDPPGGVRGK